jgi:AraC-like DNA-binding protein
MQSLLAQYAFHSRPAHTEGPMRVAHADTFEVNLITRGFEWAACRDGRPFLEGAGSFSVIPTWEEHSSWTRDQPVSFHNIHLYDEALRQTLDELGLSRLEWPALTFRASPSLTKLFSAYRRESAFGKSEVGHALVLEGLSLQLVAQLVRLNRRQPQRRPQATTRDPASRLTRAAELLRTSPAVTHSLASLAAEAGMSRFHFARAFKKRFGVPPHAYQLQLRLEKAVELMRKPELSLTEIALEAGFGSSSRLTESFKRRFGVAPSVWRQRL